MARKRKYDFDPDEAWEEVQMDAIRARRRRAGPTILLIILIALALLLGYFALRVALSGRAMRNHSDVYNPQISQPGLTSTIDRVADVDGDIITYKGKRYRYNDHVATFLFLGIDENTPDTFELGSCNVEAYSDAIILAAMDFKNSRINFFTVSRDAMCEYKKLSPEGEELSIATGQLAIPFSYGDGRQKSLENTTDAVSVLFGNLPIYSCSAMYLDGLSDLNKAVGGVTLEPIESIETDTVSLKEGERVTLDADQAEAYIRHRAHTKTGNLERMERQKHYFKCLVSQLLTASRKDVRTALKVYNTIRKNVVSDLKLSDVIYLASKATDMSVSGDIKSVPGDATLNDENFVEYYIDEEGCFELLLKLYYEELS